MSTRSVYRSIPPAILTVGSLVSIWFLVDNLQPLQPALYAFVVCTLVGLYLAVKIFRNDLLVATKASLVAISRHKYFVSAFLSAIVVVGLLARLFFCLRFTYSPTSDPLTFYEAAKNIAGGQGLRGDGYIALFPYLAAYDNILGLAMKFISQPWLATILLNTFFDVAASWILYVLLKRLLKPTSQAPLVAFGLWLLNPINIIFSVLSLPIVTVNFFIILAIFVSYLFIQKVTKLQTKHALGLSVVLGLVTGCGNCFRPIFFVILIALTILFIIMVLTANRSIEFVKLGIMGLTLAVAIFFGIQRLNVLLVSKEIGLQAANNPAGWSIYVGSDWQSAGEWRQYQNDEMAFICKVSLAEKKYDLCHTELQRVAVGRYKSYGILKSASHFIRKLYYQAGQQNYLYNANQSIVGYALSKTSKFISVYVAVYIITIFALSAAYLYALAKRTASTKLTNTTVLFLALIMTGWFFSFMFVESAPRYSTILYPMFVIFSVLWLDNNTKASIAAKRYSY